MDLSLIENEVLLARGKYSTVRAEHERIKKDLQSIASVMQGDLNAILKVVTSDNPLECSDIVTVFSDRLSDIKELAEQCNILLMQKDELKSIAYP